MTMRVGIIIPTYNAGELWQEVVAAIQSQVCDIDDVIVIDSGSSDNTVKIAESAGFRVYSIDKKNFDHGATRQQALHYLNKADIAVYLTQDALLKDKHALTAILSAFSDPGVAAAYGRQLPRKNAKPLEAHARHFNYPDKSRIKSMSDSEILGIKTVFLSNSFSAYRISALIEAGGFPENIIACEDTYVAAKLVLNDWTIAYCAEAEVYHSHDYSLKQEFQRYFDVGAFYGQEKWIIEQFGHAKNEGVNFIKSEITYLLSRSPWSLPEMVIRTITKLIGYNLGKNNQMVPLFIKKRISLNKNYWSG